jgi:hypothetical protein
MARNLLFEVFCGALTVVLFLRKQRFESAFFVSAMIPLFFIGSEPSLVQFSCYGYNFLLSSAKATMILGIQVRL